MTDPVTLKGLLDTASAHIRAGRLSEAEAVLDRLGQEPDGGALGPVTALGLPRRLHAAQLRLAKARGDVAARAVLQYHLVPPVELLAPLFERTARARAERVRAASEAVPRILHHIWIGSAPPETTDIWRAKCQHLGWRYCLWDEAELAALGVDRDPVYRHMRERGDLPGAVDVARYHVLAAHGGLYLDCDWLPVGAADLEAAFPLVGLSVVAEDTPRLTGSGSPFLNNSVIAAPPGHPVFRDLLSSLPDVIARLPKGPAWWVTGPLVFTLACRGGPVSVLDAALTAGKGRGTRQDAEAEIADLVDAESPAVLYAWKPWAEP